MCPYRDYVEASCLRIGLKHLEIVLFHFLAHQRTKYTTGLDLARVCQWPK